MTGLLKSFEERQEMLCIYHIADHDGKGSAAIVKNIYPNAETLGFSHEMEVPYDKLKKHNEVVICDISLPMDVMFELNKTKDLVWIDHHVSCISEYDEMMESKKYEPIKGIRRIGTAAIELTWEYFYPDRKIPEGIKLLALNDLFDLKDDRVRPFEYAVQSIGVNRPEDDIWRKLINNEVDIESTVEKGRAILSWIKVRNYRLSRGMVFESKYMGKTCLCANMPQGYSEFFDSVPNLDKYDFMVNFYMDKKQEWKMTFYSKRDDVDVSLIAASFGGGGHKRAAGGGAKELPEFLRRKV